MPEVGARAAAAPNSSSGWRSSTPAGSAGSSDAAADGKVLRYVATVTPAKIAVGLRPVPASSPLAAHQGLGQPARVHHGAIQGQPARHHRPRRRRRGDRGGRAQRHPAAWRAHDGRESTRDRVRAGRRRQRRPRARHPRPGGRRRRRHGARRVDRGGRAFTCATPDIPTCRAIPPGTPRRWPRAPCSRPRARRRAAGAGIALWVRKGCRSPVAKVGAPRPRSRARWPSTRCWAAPLDRDALLEACLVAEEAVAGRHLDNIAPSLLGGIVLIRCDASPPTWSPSPCHRS